MYFLFSAIYDCSVFTSKNIVLFFNVLSFLLIFLFATVEEVVERTVERVLAEDYVYTFKLFNPS